MPEDIWQATLSATRDALKSCDASQLQGVGITNQRETIVLWDRETLASPRNAIVWQDRRTAEICDSMRRDGHEDRVRDLTGLRLDPYFSGTKLRWLAEHEPHTWAMVESGRYAIGTVDSYLVARMSRGTWHVTDVSNASRTLLFDLANGAWSPELCVLFGVPMDALPEVVPNWGELATTDPSAFCGLVPAHRRDRRRSTISPVRPDLLRPGRLQVHLRHRVVHPHQHRARNSSEATPVCSRPPRGASPEGQMTYALEGSIFVTGAAVQWLRDGLQIIGSAAETEGLAGTVEDSGGVVFVPALTGLGAPHWDPHARGLIIGITRGTTRAHIVRATLEAITCEVRDVLDTMGELATLKVDGGASANNLLCQWQADQVGVPVERPKIVETTGLGAAFLAGLGVGVWDSTGRSAGHLAARSKLPAGSRSDRARMPSTSDG